MNARSPETDDGLRLGEVVVGEPLTRDASLVFIGRIETPWSTRADCPRQGDPAAGPVCRLVLDARWLPALDGIDLHR